MNRHWNTSKICKGNSVTYSMKYSLILLQCELANFMLPLVFKSPYLTLSENLCKAITN